MNTLEGILILKQRKGVSFLDIAKACGEEGSQSNLSQKGKRIAEDPKVSQLKPLAALLGTTPVELLQSILSHEKDWKESWEKSTKTTNQTELSKVLNVKDNEERKLALKYLANQR